MPDSTAAPARSQSIMVLVGGAASPQQSSWGFFAFPIPSTLSATGTSTVLRSSILHKMCRGSKSVTPYYLSFFAVAVEERLLVRLLQLGHGGVATEVVAAFFLKTLPASATFP
eukprot:COSAG06_NODE_46435_length_347_cov_0.596774_1_plen_112_part_10